MDNFELESIYKGSDDYDNRTAKVMWCLNRKKFFVELTEVRAMGIHNESYAEDCAENFVMGNGDFSK